MVCMNIKSAIFDMDGTLIDSLMLWDVLWSTFGKKYLNGEKFIPREEDDKKVRTLTLKDAMYLIHDNYNIGKSGEELLELANDIITDFYSGSVKLKSGVKEFLQYLNNNGVKMCIEKYFLKVFSCGTLGKGKEEPDVFLLARDFLGEQTQDTWVFEDSLTAIETVAKIGMPIVGIYDQFNYGQERIKEIATEYIADGETLLKLIK